MTRNEEWTKLTHRLFRWFVRDLMGVFREFRLSYLPPLMIYFAAGISGFTLIIEAFFVKDNLALSPSFLAALAFWAGLPWALKMPAGHLVDIFWNQKSWFVYIGAAIMAGSLLIMVGLTGRPDLMSSFAPLETWYIIAALMAPIGYLLQDVVADAMTVEAVPSYRSDGSEIPSRELDKMHVTMQTLGRIAIVGGSALVAGAAGWMAGTIPYAVMYSLALLIPAISVSGVLIGKIIQNQRRKTLVLRGFSAEEADQMIKARNETSIHPNWTLIMLSIIFVILAVTFGISNITHKEIIIFLLSLSVVSFLMYRLVKTTGEKQRFEILAIATIIFVFRLTPTFGAGASWWQIDILRFDESFFGSLGQTSAVIAIISMLLMRSWISKITMPRLIVSLTIISTLLALPYVGLYWGLHEWTEKNLGFGARAIAIVDTAASSPLNEAVMIPMLAWIARSAPKKLKATYFAVFAAFTNLALSGSNLFTRYMNELFPVERGQYENLGPLMVTVIILGLFLPIITVWVLFVKKKSRVSAAL